MPEKTHMSPGGELRDEDEKGGAGMREIEAETYGMDVAGMQVFQEMGELHVGLDFFCALGELRE